MKEKPVYGTQIQKITDGFSTCVQFGTEAGCCLKGGFTETAVRRLKEYQLTVRFAFVYSFPVFKLLLA